ncbi:hypothetical protein FRC04_011911 [Tulasnella sp. 424]|nr:hypothetical protein FRC04_011911 [Tulasnella sp. 424]KAG8960034.1 hypothetical protein FRC05_007132 [Tulasnella sp. 425]
MNTRSSGSNKRSREPQGGPSQRDLGGPQRVLEPLRASGSPALWLELVVNLFLNQGIYSEAGITALEKPVNEPTELPSEGELTLYISFVNEARKNLLELYRSALEPSAVQSNDEETDELIKERRKAIQDGANAPVPSDAAKLPALSAAQDAYPMKIGRPFDKTGPPVSIYHSVFSAFQANIQNPQFKPKPNDVVAAFDLIQAASRVYPSEDDRLKQMKPLLSDLLSHLIGGLAAGDKIRPDGVVMLHIDQVGDIPLLVMEAKNEIGTVGSDPDIQGSFAFRKLWAENALSGVRNVCCCPSFILSVAGPHITIHGGVLATEYIAQPLTEMLGLANFPDPYGRAEYIAKVMAALRDSLNDLANFYRSLKTAKKEQPTSFSPFFRSYNGFTLTYTSRNLLSNRIGRAMFNAKVKGPNEEQETPVKVKFTPRYCEDAHTLLAKERLAPQLLHCGKLENGWNVVVMEYIAGLDLESSNTTTIPPRAIEDVKKAVDMLHDKNWVFGDLRRPNVMLCDRDRDPPGVGTEQGAMLVDFDWAGEDGKGMYPPALNGRIQWPEGVVNCGIMRKEHDVAMLGLLFS